MEKGHHRDIVFLVYIFVILILAVVYFTVPERGVFLENTIKWWAEFWDIFIN